MGHVFISYVHDPDHRHLESFGVMGDVTTAMRDPIFYRWHAFMDDVFQEHKTGLPPYTLEQLTFPGVNVVGINVAPDGATTAMNNTYQTSWQQSDVNLAKGLDFTPRGYIFAR